MPEYKVGDKVIFSWCKGRNNERLIGKNARVLDVLVDDDEQLLKVLFDNGEIHEFYIDRFELFRENIDPLLWKVKTMFERQPYFKKLQEKGYVKI